MSNEERKSFLADLYADFDDIMIINEYRELLKEQERGKDYSLPLEVLVEMIKERELELPN